MNYGIQPYVHAGNQDTDRALEKGMFVRGRFAPNAFVTSKCEPPGRWGVCDRAWVAHWAGKLALAGFPVLLSGGGVGEVGLVLNGFSHFSDCCLFKH